MPSEPKSALRWTRFYGVAVGLTVFGSAGACGSDSSNDSTFGEVGGTGGSNFGGSGGTGAVISVGGSAGSGFDASGGTNWNTGGTGQGGTGTGGSPACVPADCPAPPPPATPCCIAGQICGGDFGHGGCEPFGGSGGSGGGVPVDHMCNHPATGPEAAPAPPGSQACPTLVDDGGITMNTLPNGRQFLISTPKDLQPSEQLPVIFMWHWLGGHALNFFNKAQAGTATNQDRFIAVFPEAKGDLPLKWPYAVTDVARLQEEFTFFDDMYACVAQQFNTQKNCIATAGVSAGALFTDQLASARAQYFSSFMSMSGGTGGVILPWVEPAHSAPAVVLWGGPGDMLGINFALQSEDLENNLQANGHFFVECVHNCGHSAPPIDPVDPYSRYHVLWQFVFDHPYWLGKGQSPYAQGLPAGWPTWCGIGKGSAGPANTTCIGL